MTTPFVKQLGESKKYSIDYMCWKSVESILIGNPHIENIIAFDEKFFSKINLNNGIKFLKFLVFLWKKRKEYDAVVILDKHIVFNFMFWVTGYKNRYGFNRLGKEWKFLNKSIYRDKTKREVEYYLSFLELLGIKADNKKQKYSFFAGIINKLRKNNKLSDKEQALVKKYIPRKDEIDTLIKDAKNKWKKVIWIASGGWNLLMPKDDCRWRNLKNWEKLAKEFINQWNIVFLLGSKNDRKLYIENQKFIDTLWKYSIHETIYLVSQLDLVVAQEAGFVHFVGCTETPLVTIAGPTNPWRFHPFDNHEMPQKPWWIWKMDYECYDEYGSYKNCKGDEIDKVKVEDVLEFIK